MDVFPTNNLQPTTHVCVYCRRALIAISALLLPLFPSCSSMSHAPTTQMATNIPDKQALPNYWLDKPAVAGVSDRDFYRLWNACQTEVRMRLFLIDRQDYREGVLTTQPLISKQFFEVWRSDVVDIDGLANSSLATIRRTVRFQLSRQADGSFLAQPKVLVERYTDAERRLTAITEFHSAFTSPRPAQDNDVGAPPVPPPEYWYAIGRDNSLERSLVKSIQHRLRG